MLTNLRKILKKMEIYDKIWLQLGEIMMIDLHIHSNFSDGAYSVDEILEIAQKIGYTTISIVDHNTCEAYEYLKNMKNRIFEGKIISGCEFNTFYNHIPIELCLI